MYEVREERGGRGWRERDRERERERERENGIF